MKAIVLLSKYFLSSHPKVGERTYFEEKVIDYKKIHTIRRNYDHWENKIIRLQEGDGLLSLRQWSGKPYRSPHNYIVDIPSGIAGVQKVRMWLTTDDHFVCFIRGRHVDTETIANNDGLSLEDFEAWFLPLFKKEKTNFIEFAMIHFTEFRYYDKIEIMNNAEIDEIHKKIDGSFNVIIEKIDRKFNELFKPQRRFYTIDEAAEELLCSNHEIQRQLDCGMINPVFLNGELHIDKKDLGDMLDRIKEYRESDA